jgi:hypothetical protein
MDNIVGIGPKEAKLLKALLESGLLRTDNPKGFFGKLTLTCQSNRIVHVNRDESIKLD